MGVDMYSSGLEIKICDIYIYVKAYVTYGNSTHFHSVVSSGNLSLLSVIRVLSFSPDLSNNNRETF